MKNPQLFEKYKKGEHWKNHPIEYAERFSKFLKEQSYNGLLVDLGCGYGRDVNVFHKNGIKALGIDISNEKIDKAKSKYPKLDFEIQNIENLKFEDNSISAFFMINVIHYVKKEEILKEIFKKLKKGGYLFIHFNISITDELKEIDYEHWEQDILKLISDFKIIEKRIIERIDEFPIKHTHKIMELILKKE